MAVSSTSSTSSGIGNTSLRGFGGMASGLDRDSLIEAMTQRTNTKITEQRQEITRTTWKQEAYREITDQVLDLEDNFLTFTGNSNIKDADLYEKSVVTTEGSSDSTKYISASGISDMTAHVAIAGVKQLATSATLVSATKGEAKPIQTRISADAAIATSNLSGKSLDLKHSSGRVIQIAFPVNYIETAADPENEGSTMTIDYNADLSTQEAKEEFIREINLGLKQRKVTTGTDGDYIQLKLDGDNIKLTSELGTDLSDYTVSASSTAASALGYTVDFRADNFTISTNDGDTNAYRSTQSTSMADFLKNNSMTVTYGSTTAELNLVNDKALEKAGLTMADITTGDLDGMDKESDEYKEALAQKTENLRKVVQQTMDSQFGSRKVKVEVKDGALAFNSYDETTVTLHSDDSTIRDNFGIDKNASNRVNTSLSLFANREKLGLGDYETEEELNEALKDLNINGTKIEGITASTSVNALLKKINNSDAGVKASYLSNSGRFVLMATDTGSGREIDLGAENSIAQKIFGTKNSFGYEDGSSQDGQDAQLTYIYGGSVKETITSSTNTFNIDGLEVKVSGTFGYEKDADGNLTDKLDTSQQVSFSAKANVEGVTERVKKFIESYNKIAENVYKQITTRPDKSYKPLTDEQKAEMKDKEIENWENKAKEGLLYGESSVRSLSDSLQSVISRLVSGGVSYDDMKEIGITMSDDTFDGGQIKFDEDKFKAAMEKNPDKVSRVIAGDGDNVKGLAKLVEDTLTPYATRYATRNGNSYGRLVEEAGSEKLPLTIRNNQSYTTLKTQNSLLETLKTQLSTEQQRLINKYTALETAISKMNSQSSYLSGIFG